MSVGRKIEGILPGFPPAACWGLSAFSGGMCTSSHISRTVFMAVHGTNSVEINLRIL